MTNIEALTRSRFYLELKLDNSLDAVDGYFAHCSGFRRSQDLIQIREVTPQKWGKTGNSVGRVIATKIPGNSSSDNLTLIRGVTISQTLWNWFVAVEQGKWSEQRRDGDLVIYDQGGEERARFRFLNTWPITYKIADVDTTSSDFEIEQLELAVGEFRRIK